jgi:hypothetical protein
VGQRTDAGVRAWLAKNQWPRAAKEISVLDYSILKPEGILVLTPAAPLSREDFAGLSALVDGYLATHTSLHGVLVHSESFPGWDSFAGFTAHVRFVREHERKIDRVAIVTNSPIAGAAAALAKLFITADIRHFAFADYKAALAWLKAPRGHQDAHEHDLSAAGRTTIS